MSTTVGACLVYMYSKLGESCLWKTKHVIKDYFDDQPHACAFVMLRGNRATGPFRVFLDHTVADYIRYNDGDHCQTHPLEDVAFNFRWLACGSCLMYPHIFKRVMCQFVYLYVVSRGFSVPGTSAMVHIYVNAMYGISYKYLVPDEA